LAAVKGADCELAVNLAVLRSLEKARYAPLNIGHYALASSHYCHFTSPIRRYADLLVHRLLQWHLQNRLGRAKQIAAGQDLVQIGEHISFAEQRAEDAEEELTKVLILQMLSKKIGDELDCVVTGLTNFGVFVQSRKFGIEGLIRLEGLGPDQWKYNERAHCITGERSGYTVGLGQSVKVRIDSVNVPARQLNVSPVKPLAGTSTGSRKGKRRKKLGNPTQKHRK
jgi:ribonuclease R